MSSGNDLKRIAVFCGANSGTRSEYLQSAKDVGAELVKRKIGLVYGGVFPKHLTSRTCICLGCGSDSWHCRRKCWYDGSCGADSKLYVQTSYVAALSLTTVCTHAHKTSPCIWLKSTLHPSGCVANCQYVHLACRVQKYTSNLTLVAGRLTAA